MEGAPMASRQQAQVQSVSSAEPSLDLLGSGLGSGLLGAVAGSLLAGRAGAAVGLVTVTLARVLGEWILRDSGSGPAGGTGGSNDRTPST